MYLINHFVYENILQGVRAITANIHNDWKNEGSNLSILCPKLNKTKEYIATIVIYSVCFSAKP